ncbi:SMI1/KNR4 family protein [Xenorhabdus khoisanae]|uniref:SMI1/KNR4 family protein n=1 Tax=Xenorhabdus khoisanae TaxID=880157 RepID=UPI002358E68A|nr:SMI1/KNR4 family protein [Xenorhabdus khoisanae]MDC9616144.1 SMI1/KNR4 family protein [Xenorhabdus khoisanae]
MSIERLKNILPLPVHPNENGEGEKWLLIDEQHVFPKDYIDFITQYGTGRIADFITIFNPFSADDDLNFFKQKEWIIEDFQSLVESDPDYYPFILYPDTNGLLPVGVTDNGDYIFWIVSSDDSDSWNIAVIAARAPEVEYRQESFTDFLAGVLSRKIQCMSFPDSFPSKSIEFSSI